MPNFPTPFTPHCRAMCRLLPRPLESEHIALRGEPAHNEQNAPRPSRGGRTTSRELAVVLAQSPDGIGARADASPPTALVSQEVDAPRRILLLVLLLLSLVVDERVAVPLVSSPLSPSSASRSTSMTVAPSVRRKTKSARVPVERFGRRCTGSGRMLRRDAPASELLLNESQQCGRHAQ